MDKINNFVRDLKEIIESRKFIALDQMNDYLNYYPKRDEHWEYLRAKAEAYDWTLKVINSLLTQYKES